MYRELGIVAGELMGCTKPTRTGLGREIGRTLRFAPPLLGAEGAFTGAG
jgi:hypothetical protein